MVADRTAGRAFNAQLVFLWRRMKSAKEDTKIDLAHVVITMDGSHRELDALIPPSQ